MCHLAHWQGAGLSDVRSQGAGLSDVNFCPEMAKIPLKNRLPKGARLSDVRLRCVRSGFGRCRPQRRELVKIGVDRAVPARPLSGSLRVHLNSCPCNPSGTSCTWSRPETKIKRDEHCTEV